MPRVAGTLLIALATFSGGSLSARTFQSTYLEFELPAEWSCELEQTAWVCTDDTEGRAKSATIILVAKVRGSEDRLDVFEDHLSSARPVTDTQGNPLGRSSRVEFVKPDTIGGRIWIHARHYESELPNYYTEYLATVDDRLAILVTLSADRNYFGQAYQRFVPSIASIRARGP